MKPRIRNSHILSPLAIVGPLTCVLAYFMTRILPMLSAAFCLLVAPGAFAANWYVDNAVTASGNGTSWANAWKRFSNIAWSSIRPGDTLYISGGGSGKTYTGGMRVYATGTASNPITIRPGIDPGHNGRVTIFNDASSTQAAFFIQNVNYVTVSGLYITTPTNSAKQTDGIYLQSYGANETTSGIILENNEIIITNVNDTGHNDCIQTSWRVTNLTIRNNYCEQRNTSDQYHQGLWLTGSNGTLRVTNNIIYLPNSQNTLIGAMPTTDGTNPYGNSFAAYILNNTLVGGKWGNIDIENSSNAVIKNNIIRSLKSNSVALSIQAADPAAAKVDYNLFYAPDGKPKIYYHESQYLTLTQWKAKGYDVHSRMADPQLVDIADRDFSLKGTSPAINAGIADPNAPAIGYIGTLRPQGSAFDIGAHEYK